MPRWQSQRQMPGSVRASSLALSSATGGWIAAAVFGIKTAVEPLRGQRVFLYLCTNVIMIIMREFMFIYETGQRHTATKFRCQSAAGGVLYPSAVANFDQGGYAQAIETNTFCRPRGSLCI